MSATRKYQNIYAPWMALMVSSIIVNFHVHYGLKGYDFDQFVFY